MSILCSMVGASFVTAAAEVIRRKLGITAVGNAQVDTAQSKFGGSSALFDGTGDYLIVQSNPLTSTVVSGSFTIEFWFRFSSGSVLRPIWSLRDTGGTNRGVLYISSANTITWWNGGDNLNHASTLSANTWYHIACVKDGSIRRLLVDGANMVTDSNTQPTGDLFQIGRADYTSTAFTSEILGHIDEFRISNTARYTTTFTPSTTPFVNDANTLFLMHADGTDGSTFFEDDNGVRASRSLIANGNAQIDTAQSKFGGSSLLLDGSGDYLTVREASNFNFGTSDFTLEYWFRPNASTFSQIRVPFASRGGGGIGNGDWWCELGTNAKIYWGFKNQAGTQYYANLAQAESAFSSGVWYHIALVRSGNSVTYYRDGVATGGATTVTGSFGGNDFVYVGALGPGGYSLDGHIDEVRISNSARYTTGFTPSTTPFVNDANTLLLIHCDGTDATTVFRDDNGARAPKGISALGNAQVDTAQSKFGGSSALFDGTDDRLEIYPTTTYDDFTVECWIRLANNSGTKNILAFGNESSGRVFFAVYNDRIYWDQYGVTSRHGNTSMSSNTWYHLAWSRTGSTIKLFVDGVEQTMTTVGGSGTFPSGAVGNTNGIFVGTLSDGAIDFNGHIDEIRVSNSVRYTTGFTPSTTPFQNDANTVLLLHMDGTDASTAFTDDNGIAPYTP